MLAPRRRSPRCLLALIAAACLAGCDARNPAQISRERHPEYYDGVTEAVAVSRRPAPAPKEPLPAPDFSELPGETVVVEQVLAPVPAARHDLAAARGAGALQIDVNDPSFTTRLDALFDGDTSTLSRSEDVNPLILVLRFETPISLAAVRVFPSYSTYDWAVRPHPDQPRYLVRGAAEEEWSRIDLPRPIETTEVRLELRRLVRDNYVHINEVELLPAERERPE
ncbi:MAG TPA: hypothetical protein VMS86_00925 [Thermoanaerobaculia bacterium]|nr:hypothetical protein [Thermoanaerobaculia bacterium]